MQTIIPRRIAPYVAIAVLLALTVVLPPKYLAAYVLALGMAGGIWGLLFRRALLLSPTILAILVPMALGAIFCLLGTFPVHQQSDIQLEFLKYAVYTGAFVLGLVALGEDWKTRAFVISVIAIICLFFIAAALTSGPNFGINQSWGLYPPDQNNSSSILVPFSAIILTFRPRWLKIALLLVLFLFFTFAESRFGVIVIFAIALVDLFLDRKSAAIVLAIALLVSGLFSLSNVGPQTTIMRAISAIETPAPSSPGAPETQTSQPVPRTYTNRIVQFGTSSDNTRIKIYERALTISAQVFPNLVGMGDAEVVNLLNTPPIDNFNIFQHAHNFFFQSYLAYGLLATLFMFGAMVGIVMLAAQRRNWYLFGVMVLIGAYGMIEALVSDLRVLSILMMLAGSGVAATLRTQTTKREQ